MTNPRPDSLPPDPQRAPEERFELSGTIEGRPVRFEDLELWWTEPEPPMHLLPGFTLITCAEAPGDRPRIEIECPVPDATTFRDLRGATFRLSPLSTEAVGGWMSVDVGRDWRPRGFAIRDWVARQAVVRFDDTTEDVLSGTVEAELERSAAKGGPVGAPTVRLSGRFRVKAPRW